MSAPLFHAKHILRILLCAALLAGPLTPFGGAGSAMAAPAICYVKAGAAGLNDGSSWANAYRRLQDALAAAGSGDQIWVAAGVYTPSTALTRTDIFQLKAGLAVYGGFAGTETQLSQRNWATHVVTLTGDLLGDDGPAFANNTENSYHVVTGATGATLDGVTITGGNANGDDFHYLGGGMYNSGASPALTNVIFSGNSAGSGGGMYNDASPALTNVTFSGNAANTGYGGGMYNVSSGLTLTNTTFSGNSADQGGGMFNGESSPTLTDVTFSGNTANNGGGMLNWKSNPTLTGAAFNGNTADSGGGMSNDASNPALTNVTFSGNSATYGGGMYNGGSSPALANVTFSGNSATNNGGGMYNDVSSSPALTNVTFSGNAASYGGGMYAEGGSPQVRNSILWGDSPDEIVNASGTPTVTYSLVQGGYSGTGNLNSDPLFVTPVSASTAPTTTGNLRLQPGSPAIDAGDPNTATLPLTDPDGYPRIVGSAVDLGAYERQPTTIYVQGNAAGLNDGSSWANAYRRLQDALAAASSGDQIWVAAGVYTPSTALTRTDTFQLKAGVAVYGGFAGTETRLSQRNWATHVVTLTGDLLGNDGPGFANNTENSYHVVTGATGATLDGVTITGGNANGALPHYLGGGMFSQYASNLALTNVTFSGNSASSGGGLFIQHASDPALTDVTFSGNSASTEGGGIFSELSSNVRLTNVAFSGNSATYGGGMGSTSSSPVLTNVTFSGNSASSGGGLYSDGADSPQVRNSILWGDSLPEIFFYGSGPVISYSLVQGGYSGTGNLNSDPLFVTPVSASTAPTTTGNLRLQPGSPAIDAGDPNTATLPLTDLDGHPRIFGSAVDLGAYECQFLRVFLPLVRR